MSQLSERCWHTIGVWSPQGPSCPELEQHVHCKNCPVYQAEGHALLERPPPDGWVDENTRALAEGLERRIGETASMVLVRLGTERFTFPASVVDEVIPRGPIQPIPHRAGRSLMGLVNHRGRLIPCLSLAAVLEVASDDGGQPGGRLVVLSAPGGRLGVPVDEVLAVRRLPLESLQPPPGTLKASSYAEQLALDPQGAIVLLNAARLIHELERRIGG